MWVMCLRCVPDVPCIKTGLVGDLPAGQDECLAGCSVSSPSSIVRVGNSFFCIPDINLPVWPSAGGPVCLSFQQEIVQLHHQVSQDSGRGSGCIHGQLEQVGLHLCFHLPIPRSFSGLAFPSNSSKVMYFRKYHCGWLNYFSSGTHTFDLSASWRFRTLLINGAPQFTSCLMDASTNNS